MTITQIAKSFLVLSILSIFGSCTHPVGGLGEARPMVVNGAPVQSAVAMEIEQFIEDHKWGWWKKSPVNWAPAVHTPLPAPDDYVLVDDSDGRKYTYGYLGSQLIRKRGLADAYYYKNVPESEIHRLKSLLERAN